MIRIPMKSFRLPIAAAVFAALTLSGCLETSQYVEQKTRMDQLQDEVMRLKRSMDDMTAAQAARPAPDETVGPRLAQLGERTEQMDRDLQAVKGKQEEIDHAVSDHLQLAQAQDNGAVAVTPLRAELKDLGIRVDALSRRLAEVAVQAQTAAAATNAASAGAVPGATPALPAISTDAATVRTPEAPAKPVIPKELYDSAYALYREGKFAEAQEKFKDYVRRFPDTPLTDNAYFWIGETFYDQGQYEQAILQYDKVVQLFPDSDKLASALLKQAFSFSALGDVQDAKILLRKIIQEHPSSEQAGIAKKKMELLGGN